MVSEIDQQVIKYLSAITEKWDTVQEDPKLFWEVAMNIARGGEQLPDIVTYIVKEPYQKSVAKLVISMIRAMNSYVKENSKLEVGRQ